MGWGRPARPRHKGRAWLGLTVVFVGGVWGAEKVTVTREENKPATISIKAGDEVYWVNGTGGTAHITFGKNAPRF